jgi:hypothetical protein
MFWATEPTLKIKKATPNKRLQNTNTTTQPTKTTKSESSTSIQHTIILLVPNNTYSVLTMCDFDDDHTGKFMKITRKMIDPITFAENYEVTSHLEDTSIDQTYYQGMQPQESQKVRKVKVSKERRFSDKVEIFIIPDLDENSIEELFYTEDQVADMRHEAFLESCGLSPADFDCEIDSD